MSRFNSSNFDEDDGDDWVPLESLNSEPDTNNDSVLNATSPKKGNFDVTRAHDKIDLNSTGSNGSTERFRNPGRNSTIHGSFNGSSQRRFRRQQSEPSTSSESSLNETLANIRNRHERIQKVKENIVNRPLLIFPKLFFYHLVTEFWYSSRTIRVGKFQRRRCFQSMVAKSHEIIYISLSRNCFHTFWALPSIFLICNHILLQYIKITTTDYQYCHHWIYYLHYIISLRQPYQQLSYILITEI